MDRVIVTGAAGAMVLGQVMAGVISNNPAKTLAADPALAWAVTAIVVTVLAVLAATAPAVTVVAVPALAWAVTVAGVTVLAVLVATALVVPVATVLAASVVAVPVSAWAATDKSGKKASTFFRYSQRSRVIQRGFAFW